MVLAAPETGAVVGGAAAEVVEQVVGGALAAVLTHLAGSCITDSECLHVHPYPVASLMAGTGTHQGASCRRGTHCRTCARDALPAVLRFSPASKWGPVRAVYHQSLLYRHPHSTAHNAQYHHIATCLILTHLVALFAIAHASTVCRVPGQ